jgi:hypothetical protein
MMIPYLVGDVRAAFEWSKGSLQASAAHRRPLFHYLRALTSFIHANSSSKS